MGGNMNWLDEAKKREDEIISDIGTMVAYKSLLDESTVSENAPFGKALRQTLDGFLNIARRDGFKVRDLDGYAGVVEYGEGEEIVGVLGHLDVVPPGTGWTKDPFVATIDRGYLFGRGTSDDKGPTMLAYNALKMIRDSGIKLSKRIFLIVGCDEETGMRCMDYYNKHGEIPNLGFVPDNIFPLVYGEKGGANFEFISQIPSVIEEFKGGERPNIVIGEAVAKVKGELKKAELDFYLKSNFLKGQAKSLKDGTEYKIIGEYAHGSTPEQGVNAGYHLLNFIGAAYNDEYAKSICALLNNYYGKSLNIMFNGAHMGYLTVNIGIIDIKGGNQKITIDIRHPNDITIENIENNIIKATKEVNPHIHVELKKYSPPLFVDPNSKLVKSLEASYRKYSGDNFTPLLTSGGGTYARCFDNFVAFGPEFPGFEKPSFVGEIHAADEAINIEKALEACAIYASTLESLAK